MFQAIVSLIPIMLLIGLGAFLFKAAFITSEIRSGLDKFTYWVALPSLFIHELSDTDFQALQTGDMVLVLALSVVVASLVAAVIGLVMRLSQDQIGVFVQVGFRGNMAFVGLPLIIFAMEASGTSNDLVSSALIALAALVPLNNLIAVLALILAKQGLSFSIFGNLVVKVISNPLIICAIVGGLIGWFGATLPAVIDRPFELLGQTAIALALVSLGGALIELEIKGRIGLSVASSIFKVAAVPLIAYALTVVWNLPPDQTFVVMVFSACPSATASYILTTQLGGDDALAAAGIIISTLLSFISLAVVLALF